MVMPRYFAFGVGWMWLLCMVYVCMEGVFLLDMLSNWHLSGWNCMDQVFSQRIRLFMSACKILWSFGDLIFLKRALSSAKSLTSVPGDTYSGRSLM